jgi:hypothetical protein
MYDDDKDFLGNPCKSKYENGGMVFIVETPCHFQYKFDSLLYARWNNEEYGLSKTPEGRKKCFEKSMQVWNEGRCAVWFSSSTGGELDGRKYDDYEHLWYEGYIC